MCNFTSHVLRSGQSVVTHSACGILLSLSSHAEWFVFPILRASKVTACYAVSICKYAHCPTAGCLLFVCVGCVLCLLKGSLRRTPLWWYNHGNWPENALFICLCCLSVPYSYFFISFHSLLAPREDFNVFFPFFLMFAL